VALSAFVALANLRYINALNNNNNKYSKQYTRARAHLTALCPGLDFTEARDSEWQWRQLGHMQGCTSLQTDNHASTPPLIFLQAGCPSCRPTNSVKAPRQ